MKFFSSYVTQNQKCPLHKFRKKEIMKPIKFFTTFDDFSEMLEPKKYSS